VVVGGRSVRPQVRNGERERGKTRDGVDEKDSRKEVRRKTGAGRDDEKCGGPFNAAACSTSRGPPSEVGLEAGAARPFAGRHWPVENPPNCGAAQLNGTLLIAPVGRKVPRAGVSARCSERAVRAGIGAPVPQLEGKRAPGAPESPLLTARQSRRYQDRLLCPEASIAATQLRMPPPKADRFRTLLMRRQKKDRCGE
jgi:hypothetical protein